MIQETEITESQRVEMLSTRLEILFGFCAEILPDIDLLQQAYTESGERASFSLSAAPLLGALGQDFDRISFDWSLKAKRAKAVINLLEILRDTEKERQDKWNQYAENAQAANDLRRYLGI